MPAALFLVLPLWMVLSGQSPVGEPVPVRIVESPKQPKRLKSVAPVYPKEAQRAGLAQDVVVECTVDPQGGVSRVDVLQGVPPLTDAAIKAVKKWRYEPTVLDGVTVPVIMTVTVHFELQRVRYGDLMGSLDSRNEHIRAAAASNLGGLRPSHGIRQADIEQAIHSLERLAVHDDSPRVREAAQRALTNLDQRPLPPELAPRASSSGDASRAVDAAVPDAAGPEPTSGSPAPEMTFDAPPRVLHGVRPEYPRDAFDKRIEGTVLIEALVDTKGVVAECRVLQSVPGLDEAALAAARQWRFQPAVKHGKPVATIIHMPVAFRIYDRKK